MGTKLNGLTMTTFTLLPVKGCGCMGMKLQGRSGICSFGDIRSRSHVQLAACSFLTAHASNL